MTRGHERRGLSHRCRHFIILVNANADANPERNENASDTDHETSKAECVKPYTPQSRHECVDRKDLVRYAAISLRPEFIRRWDNKSNQANSKFAYLLDDALCRAIGPGPDDPVVSPPHIEYATQGLYNIKYEKGKLGRKLNRLNEG